MPATVGKNQRPTPEYFERQQQKYVMQVSRGRHPRSFPRVSELWYHALATGKRLDQIRAGHNVWHVLEESAQGDTSQSQAQSRAITPYDPVLSVADSDSAIERETPSVHADAQPAVPPAISFPPLSAPSAAANDFGTCIINGMQIDIRNKVQLHYGMMAVLMSERNDVVCVSPENEIKIKPRHSILHTDRTLFKLVDLRDLTSPHAVKYGEPLWLQIVDVSGNPGTTYGWNQAVMLCSKLFQLHEMDTKHLNPVWEKDNMRAALIHNHALDDDESRPSGDNEGAGARKNTSFGSPGASKGTQNSDAGVEYNDNDSAVSDSKAKATSRASVPPSGWKRLKEDMNAAVKTQQDTDSPLAQSESANGSPPKDNESVIDRTLKGRERKGAGKERDRDMGSQSGSSGAAGRGHAEPEAIICGGAHVVLIGAVSHTAARNLSDDALAGTATGGKVISREALTMGQVALHAADSKTAKAPGSQLGDVARSNTSLYLAQDLYCFASSQGNKYVPWPPTSKDIAPPPDLISPKKSPEKSKTYDREREDGGGGGDVPDDATVNSRASGNTHHSARTAGTTESVRTSATGAGPVGFNGKPSTLEPHVVSRKLLAKKPPYEYVVDKRCVFRFCTVDNVSDTSTLSVQEIAAQRLLSKAKAGLRRSEMTRKGGKIYPEEPGDVVSIPSGERFSRSLRLNVSSKLLQSESSKLLPRRQKEKVIESHFRAYCGPGWDLGDEVDDVSVASLKIVNQMIRPGHGHGRGHKNLAGGSVDGGLSIGSLSVDESLNPLDETVVATLNVNGNIQGVQGYGHGESVANNSIGGSTIATRAPRVPLPSDHRSAYDEHQAFLLEQSMRAKVTRPYHYNDYPQYYKHITPSTGNPNPQVLQPPQINYLNPRLSVGETVMSLRQTMEHIGSRILHDMDLDAKLAEMNADKSDKAEQDGWGGKGGGKASSQPRKKDHGLAPTREPRIDMLAKLYEQDQLIGSSIDHVERLLAIESVKKGLDRFRV